MAFSSPGVRSIAWLGVGVDGTGILLITRRESPEGSRQREYMVAFLTVPLGHASPARYRCAGDAALLRALEELLPSVEARLQALEQLRDAGQASVRNVPLSDVIIKKFERAHWALVADGEAGPDASRDVTDDIAKFLDDGGHHRFCHTCVASLFSIPLDRARKVVGLLRARPGFQVDSGACSVCGKQRPTIWVTPG